MGLINVKCNSCATHSCLQCYNSAHRPLSCAAYKKWTRLNAGDEEIMTIRLIEATTKECPAPKCERRWSAPVACLHVECSKKDEGCGY